MTTMTRFRTFVQECKRVLTVTKKPSSDEFKSLLKVTGLGLLLIGFIGFVIHMIKQMLL